MLGIVSLWRPFCQHVCACLNQFYKLLGTILFWVTFVRAWHTYIHTVACLHCVVIGVTHRYPSFLPLHPLFLPLPLSLLSSSPPSLPLPPLFFLPPSLLSYSSPSLVLSSSPSHLSSSPSLLSSPPSLLSSPPPLPSLNHNMYIRALSMHEWWRLSQTTRVKGAMSLPCRLYRRPVRETHQRQ